MIVSRRVAADSSLRTWFRKLRIMIVLDSGLCVTKFRKRETLLNSNVLFTRSSEAGRGVDCVVCDELAAGPYRQRIIYLSYSMNPFYSITLHLASPFLSDKKSWTEVEFSGIIMEY